MSKYVDVDYINDFFDKWEEEVRNPEPLTFSIVQNVRSILNEAPTIEVSEDCIDRKALLKQIEGQYGEEWHFVDTIKDAPSVVPSRAEGKWIRNDYEHAKELWDRETKCSICGYKLGGAEPNYCPNCGARMESDAE